MQQLIILIVALALAGALIRSDDIDLGKVTKTVLVIDEAQDSRAGRYHNINNAPFKRQRI